MIDCIPARAPSASADDGKGIVLFDGKCPLCLRSVALLRRLDWFGRLAFRDARDTAGVPPCGEPLVPAQLLEQMHVVTPDRRRAPAGFRAFRWMAWRLPLAMPLAPLLYAPGVPWLGQRMYHWVARNRYDLVPCDGGACRVPPHRS